MISKEEFDKTMVEERAHNQRNMDKILTSLGLLSDQLKNCTEENNKMNEEVKDEIGSVSDQMRTLQTSVDETRIKFEHKLVELEGRVNRIQDSVAKANTITTENVMEVLDMEVIPKIREGLKKEILSPVEVTWNAIQAQKVQEHEHNMIVFRYEGSGSNPIKGAADFLKTE